jgi:hypothetical protein
MNRKRLAVLVAIAVASMFVLPLAPAEASCPAPDIDVSPSTAPPGSTVTIEGRSFATTCNDVISCPNTGPCPSPTPESPSRGIGISFKQGGATWPLTRVDADEDYSFSVDVKVPDDAQPGPAKFVASGGWSARFTVGLPKTGEEAYRLSRLLLISLSLALATLTIGALLRTRSR